MAGGSRGDLEPEIALCLALAKDSATRVEHGAAALRQERELPDSQRLLKRIAKAQGDLAVELSWLRGRTGTFPSNLVADALGVEHARLVSDVLASAKTTEGEVLMLARWAQETLTARFDELRTKTVASAKDAIASAKDAMEVCYAEDDD